MTTTTINDVDLYYEATGTGEPLVLIHGSWGDHANWAHVTQPLATHYRVITYDRRGHSASAPATGTTEDDVADTAALIEQVAGGHAHLYGNSYGGVIALRLAATRPDLVRTVAVHEPPAFGLLAGEQHDGAGVMTAELAAVLDLIRTGAFRDAARQFVDRVAFGPGAWDEMPEEFRQVLTRNAPTFLEEADDPATDFIDLPALARAGVPIRLSYGDQSLPAFRDVVHRIATDVPSATVAGLGATGHVPQVTHPQLMTESLLAWLRPPPNATPHEERGRTTAMTALDTADDTADYAGVNGATIYYQDRGAGIPVAPSLPGSAARSSLIRARGGDQDEHRGDRERTPAE